MNCAHGAACEADVDEAPATLRSQVFPIAGPLAPLGPRSGTEPHVDLSSARGVTHVSLDALRASVDIVRAWMWEARELAGTSAIETIETAMEQLERAVGRVVLGRAVRAMREDPRSSLQAFRPSETSIRQLEEGDGSKSPESGLTQGASSTPAATTLPIGQIIEFRRPARPIGVGPDLARYRDVRTRELARSK